MASCSLELRLRLIGTLSKGFRQRVGTPGRHRHPDLLVLDEPTAGLDPEQVADMRSLIRSLRHERTVILSTHILSEVEATCDRVIIIHRGRVLALDTPANLNRRLRPTSQVHIEVRGPASEVAGALRAVPGVLAVERPTPTGRWHSPSAPNATAITRGAAAAIARRGWGLRELRPQTSPRRSSLLVGTDPTLPRGTMKKLLVICRRELTPTSVPSSPTSCSRCSCC
jgi:ABC-2 type transport system ATP-binding protein